MRVSINIHSNEPVIMVGSSTRGRIKGSVSSNLAKKQKPRTGVKNNNNNNNNSNGNNNNKNKNVEKKKRRQILGAHSAFPLALSRHLASRLRRARNNNRRESL
jgi:hypothetical protein